MNRSYFNFSFTSPQSAWERGSFFRLWWRLGRADRRWTPPYYPHARQALEPLPRPASLGNHLSRLGSLPVLVEARRRRTNPSPLPLRREQFDIVEGGLLEEPVAALVSLLDPRRRDGASLLAWLHAENDLESLERLLDRAAEEGMEAGYSQQIGPMELSPYLGWGALLNAWDQYPPLGAPYHPPYLAELLDQVLQPAGESQLYWLEFRSPIAPQPSIPTSITTCEPQDLAGSLLPLLAEACRAMLPPSLAEGAPPLDAAEAAFLLQWLSQGPLHARVAWVEGQPAGFILLQGDTSPAIRRANGGRNLAWRLWLERAIHRPVPQGRLVWGCVMPPYRRQGIGRQLLHVALEIAAQQGWWRLAAGPIPTENLPAGALLTSAGAEPLQAYRLYRREV